MLLPLPQCGILSLTQWNHYEANIKRKIWGCRVLLSRTIVPIVWFIWHRQLGNCFLSPGYYQQPNISTRLYKDQYLTPTKKLTTLWGPGQCTVQDPGANCSSDVSSKIFLAGVESLAQSPACKMDNREMPDTKATDAAAPQRILEDICTFATPKILLTQEEIILPHMGMWCLLLPKTEYMRSIWLLPERLNTA